MDVQTTNSAQGGDKPPFTVNNFTVFHQKVELDINFSQVVTGHVEVEIHPESKDIKDIFMNARQCQLRNITVNGMKATYFHVDPCTSTQLHLNATAHQYDILSDKISGARQSDPKPNLVIAVPPKIVIKEVNETEVHTQDGTVRIPNAQSGANDLVDATVAKFTPLKISIDFVSQHMRDLVQFVTGPRGSGRWPHAFTRGKPGGATAGALFPCIDTLYMRSTWELEITIPQTVGDALAQCITDDLAALSLEEKQNRTSRPSHENKEMIVVCSGEPMGETLSKTDQTKKIFSFVCLERLSARQIGFAIGPFERVDLNVFRSAEDQEKLGDNAVQMYGYCLPRRSDEVKNTCLPTTKAMDSMIQGYSAAPFRPYSMCFIEDHPYEITVFAGLSMCSTRLLYPEQVLDTSQHVTRQLVYGIAAQWLGIHVIPETPSDTWVVVGIAHFMTDLFMKELCGLNEYRARMKELADEIYKQDRERPSIYDLGEYLSVDQNAHDFIALKAPVVLFILDRRMAKTAGAPKMPTIISKILTRARTGDLENNTLSTDFFQKTTEKTNHGQINDFMLQWVKGAGCPHFKITQRFNKKKLMIEMLFEQIQSKVEPELNAQNFVRDVREDWNEVWASERQNVFTGPMTIRVHEADGTPYEHVVQIRDGSSQIDIPYQTKYKRLKRTRKQRNKAAAKAAEEDDDEEAQAPVYYLGDNLQTEEDLQDWNLVDWSQEMENAMSTESFEWIRADADFEWIARIDLGLQGYMYASQLQQDRDIVSQLHALQSIATYKADTVVSSILLRTLMDRRYFHRIRYLAAQALVNHAHQTNEHTGTEVKVGKFHLEKAFDTLFCTFESGTPIIRPNDFSDHQQYLAQLAIVEAVSKIRDQNGYAPQDVKAWMLDKLKFNDNSTNDYSDAFYVATLMKGLVKTLIAKPMIAPEFDAMDLDETRAYADQRQFEQACVEEIDRFRRMDEWTSSYQNLYCRTALECQAVLAHAGIFKYSPLHFLQYTRPGNYDMLRLAAYQILIDRDLFNASSVLKYIVHCMVTDSSPLIRQELQKAFGRILGQQAIGDKSHQVVVEQPASEPDMLVVEEAPTENTTTRAEDIARRSDLGAALKGLKKDLGDNEVLKKALWDAARYEDVTLDDLATMLDFCHMLYVPEEKAILTIPYPRYWATEYHGKGKFTFKQTTKIRIKPMKRWQPPQPQLLMVAPPPPRPPQQRQGSLKLKIRTPSMSVTTNGSSSNFGAPQVQTPVQTPIQRPTPPPTQQQQVTAPPAPEARPPPPSRKITLKLGMRQSSQGG